MSASLPGTPVKVDGWHPLALYAGLAVVLAVLALVFDARIAAVAAVWLPPWALNLWLARQGAPWMRRLVPLIFGLTLVALWELVVRIYGVPAVILPPPSAVAVRMVTDWRVLAADLWQTGIRGALTGWAIGCAAAVATAVAIDRFPFLERGLLPVGNFLAALPIVGVAPIMVMWFGFDWQSKAAVVVVMVFFPVLVNAVAGLKATDPMSRELMRTWNASARQSLLWLRLPAAMPFIFNGLKIASTLALIGAIVAEFFGSPIVGMGFRISASIGQLSLDMIWAEIVVAAIAGSAFYGLVALVERRVTFWHPSQRR